MILLPHVTELLDRHVDAEALKAVERDHFVVIIVVDYRVIVMINEVVEFDEIARLAFEVEAVGGADNLSCPGSVHLVAVLSDLDTAVRRLRHSGRERETQYKYRRQEKSLIHAHLVVNLRQT